MYTVETLRRLLKDELVQRREEGCAVGAIARRLEALEAEAPADMARHLEKLLVRLEKLAVRRNFRYVEPSDLESIRAERPEGPHRLGNVPPEAELGDRILGAWQGRIAGCLLGKLCEGWRRDKIEQYLRRAEAWPLTDYLPYVGSLAPEFKIADAYRTDGSAGNVKRMMRDDDTDYTIMGLHLLEKYGPDFTTTNVAAEWLSLLPYHMTYTAERVAYRNLVEELAPPATATWRNPYREWIGAQIRCDAFGYCAPGRPELAAEFAFRDAALSHVKNGIYGEMLFAAVISAALVGASLQDAIDAGLREIPARSRLAEAVRFVLKLRRRTDDWQVAHDSIMLEYGHYHGVHTINNAALVLLGLLWGRGDFEKSITIAVMGGLDTDCNGATAGSVFGALAGSRALPQQKWIAPMNDCIRSAVIGFDNSRISDLASRSLTVARKVLAT